MRRRFGSSTLRLLIGDITRESVDAIVNAANSQLLVGSGVNGAIHAAGGPEIQQETAARFPDGCPVGSVVASAAGQLPARYVIHAVGPVWQGGIRGEFEQLRSAYSRSLELGVELNCRSLAFPALGTGINGCPLDFAADTSLTAVADFLRRHVGELDIRFVLLSDGVFGAFARALDAIVDRTN